MPFLFNIKKTVNVLVFVLQSVGGKSSFFNLCAILYLADLKHLSRYASLITGDSYIATLSGMVPVNVLLIYNQLKGISNFVTTSGFNNHFSINKTGDIISSGKYDETYLSSSEVECIFETIREMKVLSSERISIMIKDIAWHNANENAEVSLEWLTIASGVSAGMRNYILSSYQNEMLVFDEED